MTTLPRLLRSGAFLLLPLLSWSEPADPPEEKLDYRIAFPPAPIRLPSLLSDHAVLQRDQPIPLWGWGEPYKTISIELADQVTTAEVGLLSVWSVELPPLNAGGPHLLTIGDGTSTAVVSDVYIGDVWLCGGQSNMVQTLAGTTGAEAESAAADYPQIRLFQVPRTMGFAPQNDYPSGAAWKVCTPDSAARFSAIAYHFGRELHTKLNVPIGIIEAAWVNTMTTLWISEATNSYDPEYSYWLNTLRRTSTSPGRARLDDERRWNEWMTYLHEKAEGSTGTLPWYSPDLRMSRQWKRMQMPDIWERGGLGHFDGTVWLRRDFQVPDNWEGRSATLRLNRILDDDVTWVNGIRVGTGSDSSTTRVYTLPEGLLRPGKNNLTLRIVDTWLWGGLTGTSSTLFIEASTADGRTSIPLGGEWRVRAGLDLRKAPPRPFKSTEQWPRPAGIYNGMIAPLVSYGIRGIVWYQGEADDRHPFRYRFLLRRLIRDWRARWKRPDMPFIFAQLAGYGPRPEEPEDSAFAELRDSQSWVARRTPHAAMVPMYDLSGPSEGHFMRKKIAARRLADAAMAISYGAEVNYNGPEYKQGSFKTLPNGRVTVEFETSGPLVVPEKFESGDLPGFTVAGRDRKWYNARARLLDRGKVEIWSPKVKKPVAVRFGWATQPYAPIYNQEGLPAHPFRTDNWPLSTR